MLAAGLCAACTTDVAGYAVVTQDKYDIMTCKDIIDSATPSAREKDLSELAEKAESSPGGIIASYAAYRSDLPNADEAAACAPGRRAQGRDAPKK